MNIMEKYFIVTEESSLHKDYFDYKSNTLLVNELAKKLLEDNKIETRKYYATDDEFYILPTEADSIRFAAMLGKPDNWGTCKFKKNSNVTKMWVQLLKMNSLKVIMKPHPTLYMRISGGKYRSRLFDTNKILYASLETEKIEVPNGFVEIKASEFYKIIEENQEQ